MKAFIKNIILGFVIGTVIAFPLGINFGRGDSLFSNPFAKRDFKREIENSVKQKTGQIMTKTKQKIHEATKPIDRK